MCVRLGLIENAVEVSKEAWEPEANAEAQSRKAGGGNGGAGGELWREARAAGTVLSVTQVPLAHFTLSSRGFEQTLTLRRSKAREIMQGGRRQV